MTPADFILQCQACVEAGGGAAEVAEIVRTALAFQLHEPSWQQTEEFMYRSSDLLIVNLTLPPFGTTPAHGHGMWAVVGISSGCEVDRFFERQQAALRPLREVTVAAGEVIELDANVINSIFNPLSDEARGIHVYGGDLVSTPRSMWNPTTGEEQPYDGILFEKWCSELTQHAAGSSANGI